jgi:hypothetical protein
MVHENICQESPNSICIPDFINNKLIVFCYIIYIYFVMQWFHDLFYNFFITVQEVCISEFML